MHGYSGTVLAPRVIRAVAVGAIIAGLALAPGAMSVGPSSPRPADPPGTFRVLAGADRTASAWGNRWLGVADGFVSWLGLAFRVDPAALVPPAPHAPLRKRNAPQ